LDLAQLAEVGTYKNIKSVKHIFGNPVWGVLSTYCVHRYLFSASHALVHPPNLLSVWNKVSENVLVVTLLMSSVLPTSANWV
jgi:hypothetical protein